MSGQYTLTPAPENKRMIDWNAVDTVFLDMDGTLLDLHFDNYFWLEHLPARYAIHTGRPIAAVREDLDERIAREQGTLNWYCLDFWTRSLGVNIRQLKDEVSHLVAFRPHVQSFLNTLKTTGHRVVIVTNAHQQSVELKLDITQLHTYVDRVISSHSLGLPKENPAFWDALQHVEAFEPARTLLIDDSLPVLRSAQNYGIQHLLAISQPDSQGPQKNTEEFTGLQAFSDLTPGKRP